MNKIDADWLSDPAAQAVFTMLENAGYLAYCVGGCVRNAVMAVPVADVDMATNARPDVVMALAKAAGLNPVPTGIDHGTITVLSSGKPFELTTFRNDITTDGRHAVVRFSDDLIDDAKRRDFTFNALYCTSNGKIIDPLNGLQDARNRVLKFIGDPAARIHEDYLRILRFFRFYAQYCDPTQGINPEGLAAIASNLDGLDGLSKERIGAEMRKLLGADDPAPAVATMAQTGVLLRVLPAADSQFLGPLVMLEHQHNAPSDWRRRLAIIGMDGATKALRLSRAEQKYITAIGKHYPLAEAAYRLGETAAMDQALILAATLNTPMPDGFRRQINLGATAVFPVVAADLMPAIPAGPALGAELRRLETIWIKSGFSLDKSDLI